MKIRKVAVGNAAEAFIEGNFTHPTQCMPPKKLQADRVYGMSFSIDVVKISLRHPFMTRRLAGNSCS